MEKETLMNRSETTRVLLDNHALIHFKMRLSLQQYQRDKRINERIDGTDDIPGFKKCLLRRDLGQRQADTDQMQ